MPEQKWCGATYAAAIKQKADTHVVRSAFHYAGILFYQEEWGDREVPSRKVQALSCSVAICPCFDKICLELHTLIVHGSNR